VSKADPVMQTKRQIQQLLTSAGISANRQLGQHFLIDLNLLRLLADSASITRNDLVLEVGCGTGSLTEELVLRAGRVVAVEIDRALFEIARRRLARAENLELIRADILAGKNCISPVVSDALAAAGEDLSGRTLLVANLPYNVACPVMLTLAAGPMTVSAMYVTVQKEVAQRIFAQPGTRDYGVLSILLAATGDATLIRILKPAVFWPRPRVDSAMIAFVRSDTKASRIDDMALFAETVKLFMGHRRKRLSACAKLATGRLATVHDWPQVFRSCGIDLGLRPGRLGPDDYVRLANYRSAGPSLV